MYRHGDVLLIPTTEQDPKQMQPLSQQGDDIVLAEGEATGHAHKIAARWLAALYLLNETQRVLKVQEQAELQHEEHTTIILPPGDYLVVQQQTYTPERVLPVAD